MGGVGRELPGNSVSAPLVLAEFKNLDLHKESAVHDRVVKNRCCVKSDDRSQGLVGDPVDQAVK